MGARKPSEPPSCPPDHKHNQWCYKKHGCRCDSCRRDNSRVRKEWSKKVLRKERNLKVFVSPVGATRRVHALQFMGYRIRDIAEEAGVSVGCIHDLSCEKSRRLQFVNHAKIAVAYERLHMTFATHKSAGVTSALAKGKGRKSPLYWIDIDKDRDARV